MFPILVIAIGVAILVLAKRPAVLGAAVGALLGLGLLNVFAGINNSIIQWVVVIGLAVLGAIGGRFAKGIVSIIILVLGALAGAAVVLGIFDLFNIDGGLLKWILVLLGGGAGLVLISRARRGPNDWGLIILSALVGALLVARGLTILIPSLDGLLRTLVVLVLAGACIVLQGGIVGRPKAAPQA